MADRTPLRPQPDDCRQNRGILFSVMKMESHVRDWQRIKLTGEKPLCYCLNVLKGSGMAIGFIVNQRTRRALQRAVSVLLLTLCFFDLAIADVLFPGSCERESEMLPVVVVASTATELHQGSTTITDSQQENRQAPTESSSVEDDCFCCCTHLVPVEFYKPSQPLFHSEPITSYLRSLPSAPSAELYHPPRLA